MCHVLVFCAEFEVAVPGSRWLGTSENKASKSLEQANFEAILTSFSEVIRNRCFSF